MNVKAGVKKNGKVIPNHLITFGDNITFLPLGQFMVDQPLLNIYLLLGLLAYEMSFLSSKSDLMCCLILFFSSNDILLILLYG